MEDPLNTSLHPYEARATYDPVSLQRRVGACRAILLQPLLAHKFKDWALEAYAADWGTKGPTLRHWLSRYDPKYEEWSVAPERLYQPHLDWLAQYEARILDLQHYDVRTDEPYWAGLMGETPRRKLAPPRPEGLAPDTAVPPTTGDIAEHYLERIAFWQAQTGQTGVPPRAWNIKLSNYMQWLRAHPGGTADRLAARFAELGIRLERGYSSEDAPRNHQSPRGLEENVVEARRLVASGHVPSLLAEGKEERRLAGWLVRCQTGILSERHLSENPRDSKAKAVTALVEEAARAQTAREFAGQWFLFSQRVREHAMRATKGDGWAQYACDMTLTNLTKARPGVMREVRALSQKELGPPLLISPLGLIDYINATLGVLPRPVTFRLDREVTKQATARLVSAGLSVSDTLPEFVVP
jgi:hypothetical protein